MQEKVVDEALRKNNLHIRSKNLQAALSRPVIIEWPWAEKGDMIGSPLYAMRHMEMFMGSKKEQWETEMNNKNRKRCITALRA